MKVKKGLIKGAAAPDSGAPLSPSVSPPASAAAAQTDAVPGEAPAVEAPAEAAAAQPAAQQGEAPAGEEAAAPPEEAEAQPAAPPPEEAPAAAAAAEAEAPAAAAPAAAQTIDDKAADALIAVNEFMKGFFNLFDEKNDVVELNEFPEFSNIGKLSEKIINKIRQKKIKSYIGVLTKYKDILENILE